MKITTYASAAAIVLAMSAGTVFAEEQTSEMKNMPGAESSAVVEKQSSILSGMAETMPMTNEQLGEVVGEGCGEKRRRWFHREKYVFLYCMDSELNQVY